MAGQQISIDKRTSKLLEELDVIVAEKAKYHAQRDELIKQQSLKSAVRVMNAFIVIKTFIHFTHIIAPIRLRRI